MTDPSTPGEQSEYSLRHSLSVITFAGCLAVIFFMGIGSPAQTQFFRSLGATEVHFGIIGGLPMALVFLQFVGAWTAKTGRRKKPWFILLNILGRSLYLPLVLIPLLFPRISPSFLLPILIGILVLSGALLNVPGPLWMAWMADLIPARILNRYWGVRQRWQQLTWTGLFVAITIYTYIFDHLIPLPISVVFGILAAVCVTAGVVDMLLFMRVPEPPAVPVENASFLRGVGDPFRHPDFRTFLLFQCVWSGTISFGATFMQLYALKVMGIPVWQATLIWCLSGVGNAIASGPWGRIADRYGHRPILRICTAFKPFIAAVFLLITPASAPFVLPVAFIIDGMWNAGDAIAVNGYIMKMTPRENRSTFIAVSNTLTGICGGLMAIAGGFYLDALAGQTVVFAGRVWTHYHFLFFLNVFMRMAAGSFVRLIREPTCGTVGEVCREILSFGRLRAGEM